MKKRSLMVGVLGLTTLASVQVLAEQQLLQPKAPAQKMVTASDNNNLNTSAAVSMPGNTNAVRPIQLGKKLGLKDKSRVHINGFMSAGASRTTSSVPYGVIEHGEVENSTNYSALSLIGLQIAANLSQSISIATQLVSNGDNTNGNTAYSVNADYAYLRYQLNNNLQVRAGRFRLPVFLYSETLEVGYSYPWVFLPNEVYRIVPFNNLNGADFIWKGGLGKSGWTYNVEPYAGASNSKFDLYTNAGISGLTADFEENDMYGAVVSVGNSNVTFRATYARLSLSGNLTTTPNTKFLKNQHDYYYAGGVKVDVKNIVLTGEYAHRETPSPLASLTGYYAMIGYHISKFLPTLTYARINTTNTSAIQSAGLAGELAQDQESFSLDTAYYISSNFMAKMGVSDIMPLNGTRGLFDTGTPGLLPSSIWMYSASVNAVF